MSEAIKKVYGIKDVMLILNLCRNTTTDLLKTGKLRSVRAGRRWLIPATAIDEFLNSENA